jgi:ATP-binding cassette subfamily B protein
VDTNTERQVQKAIRSLMKGKTSFVIAHRLSTIQNADQILVVNAGDVVEQGTHDSLMRQRGFYYKLYASQFE